MPPGTEEPESLPALIGNRALTSTVTFAVAQLLVSSSQTVYWNVRLPGAASASTQTAPAASSLTPFDANGCSAFTFTPATACAPPSVSFASTLSMTGLLPPAATEPAGASS